MVYLLRFPRPIGIEPTVYFEKPIFRTEDAVVLVEEEDGTCYTAEDPYLLPEVLECKSIKDALLKIIDFNHSDDYLKEIMIGYRK